MSIEKLKENYSVKIRWIHFPLHPETPQEGQTLENFSKLENFQIIEVHEENDDGILVSLLCTHPLAISAIELSNNHIHPPYGIS